MICKACGNILKDNAIICKSCKTLIGEPGKEVEKIKKDMRELKEDIKYAGGQSQSEKTFNAISSKVKITDIKEIETKLFIQSTDESGKDIKRILPSALRVICILAFILPAPIGIIIGVVLRAVDKKAGNMVIKWALIRIIVETGLGTIATIFNFAYTNGVDFVNNIGKWIANR